MAKPLRLGQCTARFRGASDVTTAFRADRNVITKSMPKRPIARLDILSRDFASSIPSRIVRRLDNGGLKVSGDDEKYVLLQEFEGNLQARLLVGSEETDLGQPVIFTDHHSDGDILIYINDYLGGSPQTRKGNLPS